MKKLSDILKNAKEITEKAMALGFTNKIMIYNNYYKEGTLCLFVERAKISADKQTEYVPTACYTVALTYDLATFLNCRVFVDMLSSFSEEDQDDLILNSADLNDTKKLSELFGNMDEILFKEINQEESDDSSDNEYNDDLEVAKIIFSKPKTPKEPVSRSTVTASCST